MSVLKWYIWRTQCQKWPSAAKWQLFRQASIYTRGGHAGDARRLGDLKLLAVAGEHRLMQDERGGGAHQGAAQIDIARFKDVVALAFALVIAGIVATTDKSGAAEDSAWRRCSWLDHR